MRFIFLLAERRRVRHRTSRIANVIARVGTVWIVFEGIFSLLEKFRTLQWRVSIVLAQPTDWVDLASLVGLVLLSAAKCLIAFGNVTPKASFPHGLVVPFEVQILNSSTLSNIS